MRVAQGFAEHSGHSVDVAVIHDAIVVEVADKDHTDDALYKRVVTSYCLARNRPSISPYCVVAVSKACSDPLESERYILRCILGCLFFACHYFLSR